MPNETSTPLDDDFLPTINLEEIVVLEGRIRKNFDQVKIEELANSIWRVGLLHPIVLRNDRQTLLAGGRRLKALTMLLTDKSFRAILEDGFGTAKPEVAFMIHSQKVPYNIGSKYLSETELLEAELFENLHRENITWQEQTAAIAQLHEIRTAQKGTGGAGSTSGQTIKATAAEVYDTDTPNAAQQSNVSQALELADYLDDPMVAAAPDEKTAAKIIRDIRKAQQRQQAAVAMEGKRLSHTIIHGDSYALLEAKDETVLNMDIIICDPPYGRDMDKHSFEAKHEYDDSREQFEKFCTDMLPLLYSTAAKTNCHLYVFSDIRDHKQLGISAFAAGWSVWPWPIIWDKGNVGSFGNAKQGPRHCYDSILYGWKGDMQPIQMNRDVIPINQQQGLDHPAGKPVALYMDLLHRSAVAGMRAFDPMVGGGTFFDACSEIKVYGTGVEEMEKYYHMAMERVGGLS